MPPDAVMIFAAGFGTRMGALTANRPKPLIHVAGEALIDRALTIAKEAGFSRIVVNLHYLGDQLATHLQGSGVSLSWERDQILETGGGLRAALPLLGPGPVATLNPDVVWTGVNPLCALRAAWNPAKMDALVLLMPTAQAIGHPGPADFSLAPDGRIARAAVGPGFLYPGAQIINPIGLADIKEDAFSLNRLWDRQIAAGRAYGLIHRGGWCDVGRPEGIALAEALLAARVTHGG